MPRSAAPLILERSVHLNEAVRLFAVVGFDSKAGREAGELVKLSHAAGVISKSLLSFQYSSAVMPRRRRFLDRLNRMDIVHPVRRKRKFGISRRNAEAQRKSRTANDKGIWLSQRAQRPCGKISETSEPVSSLYRPEARRPVTCAVIFSNHFPSSSSLLQNERPARPQALPNGHEQEGRDDVLVVLTGVLQEAPSGMNDYIWALIMDSSGKLFAGGSFTTAGGKLSEYVAYAILSSVTNSTPVDDDFNDNIKDTAKWGPDTGPGRCMNVGSGWCSAGSNVTVVATPAAQYHFTFWSGDTNGCTISSNRITTPMTAPWSLTANFAMDQFACTPVPNGLIVWWPGDSAALDVFDANHNALRNGASVAAGMAGDRYGRKRDHYRQRRRTMPIGIRRRFGQVGPTHLQGAV